MTDATLTDSTHTGAQHPAMEKLIDYLEHPQAGEHIALREHLAVCQKCRASVQHLTALQQQLRDHRPGLTRASTSRGANLPYESIHRYVDGELDAAAQAEIKVHLQQEPLALKAALHYAAHSAAMAKSAIPVSVADDASAHHIAATHSRRWLAHCSRLFAFKAPLWLSVPATALVVAGITVSVMSNGPFSPPKALIATYQDQGLIHFQPANLPLGMGFFNKANRTTKPFNAMTVTMPDPTTLLLQWPTVENAVSYTLDIKLIDDKENITVVEMTTVAQRIQVEGFNPQAGKRYEWTLSGKTSDEKTFSTKGGFVISQPAAK